MADRPGRLVLLNGPSSAGKTSLAAALVEQLDTPWIVFSVDQLHAARSRPDLRGETGIDWPGVFHRTRAGYHRALAGLVSAGCDVVGDHVLSEPWRLPDLLEVTAGMDVLLVHVTATPEVLVAREAMRGDRERGTALVQLESVFAHDDCDLVVDTSLIPAAEAARPVVELVAHPPADRAWSRLADRL